MFKCPQSLEKICNNFFSEAKAPDFPRLLLQLWLLIFYGSLFFF